MRNNTVRKMAVNAMFAALYFALSLPFMTLIFGPVQLRISEAFTLLPVFSATPIAGLTLGCVLVNAFGALPTPTSWARWTLSLVRPRRCSPPS